ncbi:MAG TPA: hypothetical protein VH115_00350 [Solirubrobacteraceae bacterium]|nr:hypothetical protein [Solirubrobacteraceae bacterium]
MRNARLSFALDQVTHARRALGLAASDLAVMRYRGPGALGDASDELTIELERICDLAHELDRCAANLGEVSSVKLG